MEVNFMRKEYNFKNAVKNPYLKKLKKQISINIDIETIEYFKKLAEETGIAYQNLMNLYLYNCVKKHLKPEVLWKD